MNTTTGKGRGRPRKGSADLKSQGVLLKLAPSEKEGFQSAADTAGLSLSAWMRVRLRDAAAKELEAAGKAVVFQG